MTRTVRLSDVSIRRAKSGRTTPVTGKKYKEKQRKRVACVSCFWALGFISDGSLAGRGRDTATDRAQIADVNDDGRDNAEAGCAAQEATTAD